MTTNDTDRDEPLPGDVPDADDAAPAFPETEHIEEDGEPLGANFA